jgi:3-hydroxyisobutyrate dehydrogenase-like beta-hydroxyacid dehydrogenase
MTQIAFIGLGHMGLPMARNLLKAGFSVTAFDLAQEALDAFAQDGGKRAASAAEAVRDAQVVVSMLPASRHVEGLYLGSDRAPALLQHIAKGALVIDSSTIAAATSQKVAKAAEAAGISVSLQD